MFQESSKKEWNFTVSQNCSPMLDTLSLIFLCNSIKCYYGHFCIGPMSFKGILYHFGQHNRKIYQNSRFFQIFLWIHEFWHITRIYWPNWHKKPSKDLQTLFLDELLKKINEFWCFTRKLRTKFDFYRSYISENDKIALIKHCNWIGHTLWIGDDDLCPLSCLKTVRNWLLNKKGD